MTLKSREGDHPCLLLYSLATRATTTTRVQSSCMTCWVSSLKAWIYDPGHRLYKATSKSALLSSDVRSLKRASESFFRRGRYNKHYVPTKEDDAWKILSLSPSQDCSASLDRADRLQKRPPRDDSEVSIPPNLHC
jgi:hypothetical protein